MRDLDAAFLSSLSDAHIDDFAVLVTLVHPDLPTQFLALDTRTIIWGPTGARQTYNADRGEFGVLRQQLDQEPPEVQLKLQNLDDAWTDRILKDGLKPNTALVDILVVRISVDPTDKATSKKSMIAETTWTVSGGTVSGESATFTLGQPFNVLGYDTPGPPLGGLSCIWQRRYKGPECGSLSPLLTCSGTIAACRERFPLSEALRFSTFPFMDGKRTIF